MTKTREAKGRVEVQKEVFETKEWQGLDIFQNANEILLQTNVNG